MSINPDLRNQYTTLDAERAKNTISGKCDRCGVAFGGRGGNKKFCGPCADIVRAEYTREWQKANRVRKPRAVKPKIDVEARIAAEICLDCGREIRARGKQIRCSDCAFSIMTVRNRIRAARHKGCYYRLTDLEIPKARQMFSSGLRTDEIATEMGLPEAAIANSLWAEKFGDRT